jgi:hypothetical protein
MRRRKATIRTLMETAKAVDAKKIRRDVPLARKDASVASKNWLEIGTATDKRG